MVVSNDSEELITFTQTSNELYDRHNYKLICNNGDTMIFDNYYDVQMMWHHLPEEVVNRVEVVDKKKKRGKKR